VIPGYEFTEQTVAAMAEMTVPEAVSALDTLTAGHLVDQLPSGRYAMHDLIGEYAREHPSRDPEGLRRLLRYLVGGAGKAISLMAAGTPHTDDDGPAPDISSAAAAMAWLDSERVNLAAAMHAAISGRMLDFASRLAAPLWRYFLNAERVNEWVATFETAVSTMDEVGADAAVRFQFQNLLGAGYLTAGRLDDALEVHERCLAGQLEIGDELHAARSRINIAICYERQGRYADALPQMRTALQASRRLADRSLQMLLLGANLPTVLNKMGLHAQARDCLLEAVKLVEESGTPFDLLRAQHHLGEAYVLLGEPELALPVLEEAMRLAKELTDRRMQALTLVAMGVAHRQLGEFGSAIELIAEGTEMCRQPSLACEGWNLLGATHLLAGNLAQSRAAHEQALKMATEIGSAHERARALVGLAKLERDTNPVAALAFLAEALPTLEGQSANEAAEVRHLIHEIHHAGTNRGLRR
jgi:tetratricopeptide (TPR) repeat protein